jgi:hypothetical protein
MAAAGVAKVEVRIKLAQDHNTFQILVVYIPSL